jgi:hypothetical protein
VDLATLLDLWSGSQGALHVYVHGPFGPSRPGSSDPVGVEPAPDGDAGLYERYYDDYLPAVARPFLPMLEARPVANYLFGGGTASRMRPDTMRSVFALFPGFQGVRSKTFEIHPACWSEEQLDVLAEHAFNCCIVGVHSFDERVLERQRRIPAPFERIRELCRAVRGRGMWLAVDLTYRMDPIDADAIFQRDLERVGALEGDVLRLALPRSEATNRAIAKAFYQRIVDSGLGRGYRWEGSDPGWVQSDAQHCFRYVRKDVSLDVYRREIFPFVLSGDEASKLPHRTDLPSVLGLGSWRNPRRRTFSNIRDERKTVCYVEVNEDWAPGYYVVYERYVRDFYDECLEQLDQFRRIGPPPRGVRIVLQPIQAEGAPGSAPQVHVGVAWDYRTRDVDEYLTQLRQMFPDWIWPSE